MSPVKNLLAGNLLMPLESRTRYSRLPAALTRSGGDGARPSRRAYGPSDSVLSCEVFARGDADVHKAGINVAGIWVECAQGHLAVVVDLTRQTDEA